MSCFQKSLLCFYILSVGYTLSAYAKTAQPLWSPEDVVTLPFIDIKDISSDGKYTIMQFIETPPNEQKQDRHLRCILVNNDNLTQEIISKPEDYWCTEAHFIGSQDKVAYLVENKDLSSTLFVKDIATGKVIEIQKLGKNIDNPTLAPDGKSYVYGKIELLENDSPRQIAGKVQRLKFKLYHQKLDENFKLTGEPQLLTPDSLTVPVPYQANCIWSPDSQKLLLVTNDGKWKEVPYSVLNLIDLKEKKMRKLAEGGYVSRFLSFSSDGQKLVALKHPFYGDQKIDITPFPKNRSLAVEIIDLNTKKVTSFSEPDTLSVIGWAKDNKEVIVTQQEGTKQKLYGLDMQTQKLSLKDFPDMTVISNVILSNNQQYIAFTGENLYQPGDIYITALDNFKPKKITSVNKKIDLREIHAHSLKWKSFDGLEIEGILIYPQNYKPGHKVPLVVTVHGGPTSAESEEFLGKTWDDRFSPAVLASLGYAVFGVNFRGSTGYGEKFQNLNVQDMGGGAFKDIMSGIDYLIAQGIVDPNKLFITGASYGGFMTAWAIGQTDRFKAAVVSAGVVDWISDIGTTDYPVPMEAILGEYYWDNYELWRNSSPLSHINNVKTPVLILQGANDTRVAISQAQQLYHALKGRKIPNRLVSYQGEQHAFSGADAIKDSMNEIIGWFGKYGE